MSKTTFSSHFSEQLVFARSESPPSSSAHGHNWEINSSELLVDELFLKIFKNLEPIDLFQLRFTSKKFYRLSYDASLWKNVIARSDFTPDPRSVKSPEEQWRRHCLDNIPQASQQSLSFLEDIQPLLKKSKLTIEEISHLHKTLCVRDFIAFCFSYQQEVLNTYLINDASELYGNKFKLKNLEQLFDAEKTFRLLYKEQYKDIFSAIYLEMVAQKLTYIPRELFSLINLEELKLQENQLTFLPSEIGYLRKLRVLVLDDNKLDFLPSEIGELFLLESLWLNNNQLTYLPEAIGNLFNLWEIYCNNNLLAFIPSEIGKLTKLTEFYINGNHLTTLPSELVNLRDLETIEIDKNPIQWFPPEIDELIPEAFAHIPRMTEAEARVRFKIEEID